MAAKWLKSIPYLWPKELKNHTLWNRTQLHNRYKGVPPPPPPRGRKHEQICANFSYLFLLEYFIGIFRKTRINKMSFSFLIGRQYIFLTRSLIKTKVIVSYQGLIKLSLSAHCMKVKIIHFQSLTDWKTYQVLSNSTKM